MCIHMFIAALFTITKVWKQTKCPSIDKWIKNVYIYKMEYYSAIKNNLAICNSIDGSTGYYAK